MPMLTDFANEQARKDREAKAEQAEPVTEPTTTEPVAEKKTKRNRKIKAVTT